MTVRVKICGITNEADALAAIAAMGVAWDEIRKRQPGGAS